MERPNPKIDESALQADFETPLINAAKKMAAQCAQISARQLRQERTRQELANAHRGPYPMSASSRFPAMRNEDVSLTWSRGFYSESLAASEPKPTFEPRRSERGATTTLDYSSILQHAYSIKEQCETFAHDLDVKAAESEKTDTDRRISRVGSIVADNGGLDAKNLVHIYRRVQRVIAEGIVEEEPAIVAPASPSSLAAHEKSLHLATPQSPTDRAFAPLSPRRQAEPAFKAEAVAAPLTGENVASRSLRMESDPSPTSPGSKELAVQQLAAITADLERVCCIGPNRSPSTSPRPLPQRASRGSAAIGEPLGWDNLASSVGMGALRRGSAPKDTVSQLASATAR